MRSIYRAAASFAALFLTGACLVQTISAAEVQLITVEGDVNPVLARYIIRYIDHAEESGAECLIIEMDTPGGLVLSSL